MLSFSRRIVQLFMGLAVLALYATPMLAQAKPQGEYLFVSDSDGGTAGSGARVTINFGASTAVVIAVKPDDQFTDQGPYTIQGNQITIKLPLLNINVSGKPFVLSGSTLVLPFKVFSEGNGTSTWTKSFASSFGPNSGNKGKDGDPGKNVNDDKGTIETPSELEGDWAGKGVGAEVRFRRQAVIGKGKFNVMTLTTKHATEFFFHVFPDQHIEGEGVILYNLEPDLSGVDALAGAVKGMLGMMPFPSAPSLKEGDWGKATGSVSGKMASGTLSAPGVTSPSYSYKMRSAPQQRHFKIRGKAYKVQYNLYKIHLEVPGDYCRAADLSNPDNKLWVDYEVNLIKEEKSFPTWSPFLVKPEGDGIIRKSAGGTIYMVDSEFSGTHRDGVKPWEEYSFSWSARKTTSN